MRLRLSAIYAAAADRPAGYVAAVLEQGAIIDEEWLELTSEAHAELRAQYRPAAPEQPLPPLATRAVNYAASTARHVAAGMPERPESEVARILAICRGCEHYRPSDEHCSKCGCPLRAKAVRALDHCPLPGPRW